MVDFKIRRGLSTTLFTSPGVVNPRLVIEEGCWYLCTDTAELFLGVLEAGKLILRRINDADKADQSIERIIETIRNEIAVLKDVKLFQKINDEGELPTDFSAEDFNPNVTYFIQLAEGRVSTYVFDEEAQSYMCANSVDESVIYDMVNKAIEFTLETSLEAKLPEFIKKTLKTVVLHGGYATPED